MTTVDNILLKIVNHTTPAIEEILQKRDSRVLRSLATSIIGNFFITENQSRLLLKILRENVEKFGLLKDEISEAIENPAWSRRFRQIEQVRKMYIGTDTEGEPCLVLDFTFNSQIRKILQNLSKKIENFDQRNPGKIYYADLTEKNIVELVEALAPFNFEIDQEVKNHYETIKSWSEPDFRGHFLITNITHQNFQKAITADLGVETTIDQNIIKDRSLRYQYFTENAKNHENSLSSYIANREKPRVWVDKKTHSLSDIFQSLIELKRTPVMVIFDNWEETKTLKNMEILRDSIKDTIIDDNVGIYFRLPNSDVGKEFNKLISSNSYNKRLNDSTLLVGVQSGKIPKFFLSSNWRPMSVIVIDNTMGMRHGKTAIYSNCCDLIIEYSDEPYLQDKIIKWQ